MERSALIALALGAVMSAPCTVSAQGTEATLTGVVHDSSGAPVEATVTLRNAATGVLLSRRTTTTGRYTFAQLPLGGPYLVEARAPGYTPARQAGLVLAIGDRVVAELSVRRAVTQLDAVDVHATGLASRTARVNAAFTVSELQMRQIPSANRSYSDLALLAPTTVRGLSIAGARTTSTNFVVDGIQARNMMEGGEIGTGAPFTQSMEAIREFEVATNVYDVTQGRQGGGSLNVVTRSGTNAFSGSVFGYNRNRAFTTSDFTGRAPVDFVNTQWGASLGGPIVRDRAHFFVAFDRQDSREPFTILDLRSDADQIAAGVNRDSLGRFLDILRREYGLDPRQQQTGAFARRQTLNTLFARIDWWLGDRSRLTIRSTHSDWSNPVSGSADRTSLWEGWSSFRSRSDQLLIALQTQLGLAVTNDLKVGLGERVRDTPANTYLPRGWVDFSSALPNGTTTVSRLQFGGNRPNPEYQRDRQLQLVDVLRLERGNAVYSLGTDNTITRLRLDYTNETKGLFEFASLADLEAMRAFRYTRQVPLDPSKLLQQHDVLDASVFAQGDWQLTSRVQAMLGLRWDLSAFLTQPERNLLVERELGLRTDRGAVSADNVEPRGQLTWNVDGDDRDVVRVGAGLFTAEQHYSTQMYHMLNSGTVLADVFLTGADVPAPDFVGYRADPGTVPGVPSGAGARPSYVNLFGEHWRLPRTWKTDAAWQHRVSPRLSVGATLEYGRTTGNYHYFDRNLRDAPDFTLDNEDNRGVFVPAATISANGTTNSIYSRRSPALARVLELRSEGMLTQRTAIVNASLLLPRGGSAYGSFTFNSTRDNTSYTCCVARSATIGTPVRSDPRDLSGSWGPSSSDFRHKLVLFGTLPELWGFVASGRYIGQSGAPFSLLVGSDINGDDHNTNDLAFVFDPDDARTDPSVAASMRKVLANPGNYARDYLQRSLGQIAGRNGGHGPWLERIDVRVAKTLRPIHSRSIEFTADVFNFANLLNHGWGGQYIVAANQNLLTVVGFDQATRRYKYRVDENVGTTRRTGDPYQIQLGVRSRF